MPQLIDDMEQMALQQLRDALANNLTIGIAVGETSSLDTMAAALSLSLGLKATGKTVSVASPKEPIVAVSSLVGIDQVKQSFSGAGGDLIVSFPYREGEIEKISYTLEEKKLNIVVKAGSQGLSFNEADVQFSRAGTTPTLLFVVGTPTLSSLGNLFDPEALKNTTIVNIDNKRQNQGFGDIVMVSQQASSVSEQVAQLLRELGVSLDADIAQNLFTGIADGTENFQKPETTAAAFELAGMLLKSGARRTAPQPVDEMLRDPFFNPKPATPQMRPSMPRPALGQRPQLPQRPFAGARSFPGQQSRPANTFGSQPMPQPMNTPSSFDDEEMAAPMPQTNGQTNNQQRPQQQQAGQGQRKSPPNDWLTPKIYKGSTQV